MKSINEFSFGERIRLALLRADMTQKQLAKELNISLSGLSQIVRGKIKPSFTVLRGLKNILGEEYFPDDVAARYQTQKRISFTIGDDSRDSHQHKLYVLLKMHELELTPPQYLKILRFVEEQVRS